MPLRISNMVEKNAFDEELPPVVLPAGVAKDVFLDETGVGNKEIAYREVFNAGAANAYYAFGRDCDNITNFCAFIVPGQMLEVATRQRVSMFSVAGTTISRTSIVRHDGIQPGKNIL